MATLTCPSCNHYWELPLPEIPNDTVARCPNCSMAVYTAATGVTAQKDRLLPLTDGSALAIGMQGTYEGQPFTITGRLQYFFDTGTENQWSLFFPEQEEEKWLSEEYFQYTITQERQGPPLIDHNVPVQKTLTIGEQRFLVAGIKDSKYVRWDGFLYFNPAEEASFRSYELSNQKGEWVSVSVYSNGPSHMYIGKSIDLSQLHLSS